MYFRREAAEQERRDYELAVRLAQVQLHTTYMYVQCMCVYVYVYLTIFFTAPSLHYIP